MEELSKKAEQIRTVLMSQRTGEKEKETKTRWQKATEKRDKAMRAIFDYQSKTGVPKANETNDDFVKESGLGESMEDVERNGKEEE